MDNVPNVETSNAGNIADRSGAWIGRPPWLNQNDDNLRKNSGAQIIKGQALRHQIAKGIPKFLGDSATEKGIITVPYICDAGAGSKTYDQALTQIYRSVPLSLVWYLGAVNPTTGVIYSGSRFVGGEDTSVGGHGTVIQGGKASYKLNSSSGFLTIDILSQNIGIPLINGLFYYMIFYDDTESIKEGLI